MCFRTGKDQFRTAAWRISFWGAITFAIGTTLSFLFLHNFLVRDLQKRTDSWLIGELGVLADVTQRTPDTELHDAVIREVAELAGRETPSEGEGIDVNNHDVFFLLSDDRNRVILHTGSGSPPDLMGVLLESHNAPGTPSNVYLHGFKLPFRVAQMSLPHGQHIYLGVSTSYEHSVLANIRKRFGLSGGLMILLGGAIVFVTTHRMLQRIQTLSDAARQIGRNNLATRVPVGKGNDEISQLSITFNDMLDRIESAVQQLHTMADSIAHDIRSPITVVRGKLELALTDGEEQTRNELLASTIDDLDRLIGMLTMSLDVSEANANALRLRTREVEFNKLVSNLYDLYEPVFSDAGLSIRMERDSLAVIQGDSALLQRVVINLFDNEIEHLPAMSKVRISVFEEENSCVLQIEDNGPGFPEDLLPNVFAPYVRGKGSKGHGLGLAFVHASIRCHGGTVTATNRADGGAKIVIRLPGERV